MQMSARLVHKVRQLVRMCLGANIMSKKFSVEWLSQSFHAPLEPCDAPADTRHLCGGLEHKAPSSPANSCGYTSASESDGEGESGPRRRVRTKFSSEQISRLERTFGTHRYLGATQRRKMAEKLRLSETQVKTWFQNRRMKLKREVQDMRAAECLAPSVLPPVTSFQHHVMSGQRAGLYYCAAVPAQAHIHPMLFAPCYYST